MDDNKILIKKNFYSTEVIKKAAYELSDKAIFNFEDEDGNVLVIITLKDKSSNLNDIKNTFQEELLFHSLREEIDEKTWDMRYKILETALWFWLNIEDIQQEISWIWQRLWKVVETKYVKWDEANQSSINSIIDEIENDPEFADEKDEIINILKDLEN